MQCMRCVAVLLFLVTFASTLQSQSPPGITEDSAKSGEDLCLACHADVAAKIKWHAHAIVGCPTCHTRHEEYPHPAGVTKPSCATCHSQIAHDFTRSIHGQAVLHGNGMAPDCNTCHGTAHELVSTKTVAFRSAIPDT